MHSHIDCICLTFLHCVFLNVSLNCLHEMMHSHIGCICLTFLHCVFSNVFSKRVHEQMQSHTGYICLTFLHYVFSNVISKHLGHSMHSHIDCIYATFPHCAFSNVSSNCLHGRMQSYSCCTWWIFHFCPSFSFDLFHWQEHSNTISIILFYHQHTMLPNDYFKLRQMFVLFWFSIVMVKLKVKFIQSKISESLVISDPKIT